jgi:hypothetical protein
MNPDDRSQGNKRAEASRARLPRKIQASGRRGRENGRLDLRALLETTQSVRLRGAVGYFGRRALFTWTGSIDAGNHPAGVCSAGAVLVGIAVFRMSRLGLLPLSRLRGARLRAPSPRRQATNIFMCQRVRSRPSGRRR